MIVFMVVTTTVEDHDHDSYAPNPDRPLAVVDQLPRTCCSSRTCCSPSAGSDDQTHALLMSATEPVVGV